MKVIDLLNKIANGEEVPKKFIYVDKENVRYIFELEEDKNYWCEELGDWFFNNFSIQTILNDEIEIIEEDEEIEKINSIKVPTISNSREKNIENIEETLNKYWFVINKLIEAVNKLKKGK